MIDAKMMSTSLNDFTGEINSFQNTITHNNLKTQNQYKWELYTGPDPIYTVYQKKNSFQSNFSLLKKSQYRLQAKCLEFS